MPVTALYAGLLAFVFIALAVLVINERRAQKVSVGDGGNNSLLRRIRVHGNFTEYTPFALILIGLLESMQADHRILHALGVLLVASRCLHAYALSPPRSDSRLRVIAMGTTFFVIAISAALCIFGALWNGTVF